MKRKCPYQIMNTSFDNKISPFLSSSTFHQIPETMTLSKSEESKSKKSRCCATNCNVKLGLLGFDCRCGAKYCATHRMAESHGCTFDYKSSNTLQLKVQLVECKGDKMGGGRI